MGVFLSVCLLVFSAVSVQYVPQCTIGTHYICIVAEIALVVIQLLSDFFFFLSVRYVQRRAFLLWPHAISIFIVQSYTRKYHGFVAVWNVESMQLLIFVSGIACRSSAQYLIIRAGLMCAL